MDTVKLRRSTTAVNDATSKLFHPEVPADGLIHALAVTSVKAYMKKHYMHPGGLRKVVWYFHALWAAPQVERR